MNPFFYQVIWIPERYADTHTLSQDKGRNDGHVNSLSIINQGDKNGPVSSFLRCASWATKGHNTILSMTASLVADPVSLLWTRCWLPSTNAIVFISIKGFGSNRHFLFNHVHQLTIFGFFGAHRVIVLCCRSLTDERLPVFKAKSFFNARCHYIQV